MTGPVDGRRIAYGHTVTFRGTLTDTTTGRPIANAPVIVITNVGSFRVRTNAAGALVGDAVKGDRAQPELARRLPRLRHDDTGIVADAQALRARPISG